MPFEILLIKIVRTLIELALALMLAQALAWMVSGPRRERNPIYRICKWFTAPVYRMVRAITPKRVADGHIPFIAFVALFWIWVLLALARAHLCAARALAC
jgi:uncharacterized protein YggT (Ycf19 family)